MQFFASYMINASPQTQSNDSINPQSSVGLSEGNEPPTDTTIPGSISTPAITMPDATEMPGSLGMPNIPGVSKIPDASKSDASEIPEIPKIPITTEIPENFSNSNPNASYAQNLVATTSSNSNSIFNSNPNFNPASDYHEQTPSNNSNLNQEVSSHELSAQREIGGTAPLSTSIEAKLEWPNSNQEKLPKIINILSILVLLNGIRHAFEAIGISVASIFFKLVFSEPLLSFWSFSGMGYLFFVFMPIFLSLSSLVLFYISFRIRDRSKRSWWLGLSSLPIISVVVSIIEKIAMVRLDGIFRFYDPNQQEQLPKVGVFSNPKATGLVVTLFLILLLLSYRKFQFTGSGISDKAKKFLLAVFVFTTIPIAILSIYTFGLLKVYDFNYKKISSQVDFHVYKPNPLPDFLAYATGFEIREKENDFYPSDTVRVAFDLPVENMLKEGVSLPVVLNQASVDSSFNLEDFVHTLRQGDDDTVQRLVVFEARSQEAYSLQRPLGDSFLTILTYVTDDDVLIMLMSNRINLDTLMQLSQTLQ